MALDLNLKNEKLISVIQEFLVNPRMKFFGEFSLYINFHEAESVKIGEGVNYCPIPTAGVNATKKGFNFYYNKDFIESLNEKQCVFLILHEISHLLFLHGYRSVRIDAEPKMSNIAKDMIINSGILSDIDDTFYEKIEGLKYIPKEYDGELIFEDLYLWLLDQYDKYKEWKSTKSQKTPNNKSDNSSECPDDNEQKDESWKSPLRPKYKPYDNKCPVSKELKETFDSFEQYEFDVHMPDEVTEEMKKMFGEDIIEKLKTRGIVHNNIEKFIERLTKQKKDYLKELKLAVRKVAGIEKYKTFLRPNRKGVEGLKGKNKKDIILNCILDTSGSMNGTFEKVLSYIFQNNITINLIQCDTEVTNFNKLHRKRDFNKVSIKGLGGTVLQPAFDFIKANKELKMYNTVVLTDGYCDNIDASFMQSVLVLTTGEFVTFTKTGISVKQIHVQ